MSPYGGVRDLITLILRIDRVRLLLWMVGVAAVMVGSAASLRSVYPDQQAIESYAAIFGGNPALMAFAGPGYGLDHPTIGAILVNETQLWGAIVFAVMSVMLLIRHTRADEDAGRSELLLSAPLGRRAPLVSALIVVSAAETVTVVVCAIGMAALGYPLAGTLVLCASWWAMALTFLGVAALASQIAGSGRGALGVGFGALAFAFVVRAVGDISGSVLVWLSPIGWAQAVRPFASERWWPLVVCLLFVVAMVIAAVAIVDRRDVGAGVRTRAAPPIGRPPTGPMGVAWRRHRGVLAAWAIGLTVIGAVYGSIADDVASLLRDNPRLADFFRSLRGASLTDSYLATAVTMMAVAATGCAVAIVLDAHRDENEGRLDLVLAGPVRRGRWLLGTVGVAALGAAVVVLAAGAGLGVVSAVSLGEPGVVGSCVLAAVQTVPAVTVVLGVAAALVGGSPRWAGLSWAAVGFVVLVGVFADALDLPAGLTRVSPFEVLPAAPAEPFRLLPVIGLTGTTVALVGMGVWRVGRRDLRSG